MHLLFELRNQLFQYSKESLLYEKLSFQFRRKETIADKTLARLYR